MSFCTDVRLRWLSRYKFLHRFRSLLNEVTIFLRRREIRKQS
jgi:hypothetical protein